MDSLVWIVILIAAICWALYVEVERHNQKARFENAWDNCLTKFLLTFSDGSSKCLDSSKMTWGLKTPPILRTHFNQELWIISLHLEDVEHPETLPSKLYLHIEGVGKVTLQKDKVPSKHVMYRAELTSHQSLHYVSRRAVIGV